MGMTITEKIFARASENANARAGDLVDVNIDYAMLTDGGAALTYSAFNELGIESVWDKDKIVVCVDHASPPCVVAHTKWVTDAIRFVQTYDITNFYNMQGVSHQLFPEQGFVYPGAFIVGGDSHTVTYGALGAFSTGLGMTEMVWVSAMGKLWFRVPETIRVEVEGCLNPMIMGKDIILKLLQMIGPNGATYKALEFGGDAIRSLSVDGRLTMCNMAVEAGAKNGIIETDEISFAYLSNRTRHPVSEWVSDPGCNYSSTVHIDANVLEPMVACPHNPGNVVPVGDIEGTKVDQILLGSCTGGRMEDYRIAASIMQGKVIPRHLRCLVIPASAQVQRDMIEEGLAKIFLDCGCILSSPQCGPCGGMQMGFIGPGEVCIGTHNRNFRGRMGSPDAEIYLASPATAAATALTGFITDPRKIK